MDKIELNNVINSVVFLGGRIVMVGEVLKLIEIYLFGSKYYDFYWWIFVVMMGSIFEDDVFIVVEMLKLNVVMVFCVGVGNYYVCV